MVGNEDKIEDRQQLILDLKRLRLFREALVQMFVPQFFGGWWLAAVQVEFTKMRVIQLWGSNMAYPSHKCMNWWK